MRNSRIEKRYLPPQAKELGAEHVFVYTGTLLYVRPAADDLSPGDVVVYQEAEEGRYVVHRVVSGAQGGLVTRGDANATVDTQRVAYGQVIGHRAGSCVRCVAGEPGYAWRGCAGWDGGCGGAWRSAWRCHIAG